MFTEQGHVSTNRNRILFEIYRYRYQCYENCLQNVAVIAGQKRGAKWIALLS